MDNTLNSKGKMQQRKYLYKGAKRLQTSEVWDDRVLQVKK